jgi:hypothetical protein
MKRYFLFALILLISIGAFAERKALIIGNYNYPGQQLAAPANDILDMENALGQWGFTVLKEQNLDLNAMTATIDYFVSSLNSTDEAFFYYSGHGTHENGINYLVPAGVNMNDRQVYAGTAYSVRRLAELMARAKSTVIFLEASRSVGSNPKYFQFTRDCQPNQAIVMSARPYSAVAESNPQRSAFTQAFIQKFNQSEDPFNETMPVLLREFRASGNTRQIPWYSGPINSELYFNLNSTRWRFRMNLHDIEGGGSLSW